MLDSTPPGSGGPGLGNSRRAGPIVNTAHHTPHAATAAAMPVRVSGRTTINGRMKIRLTMCPTYAVRYLE